MMGDEKMADVDSAAVETCDNNKSIMIVMCIKGGLSCQW